MEDIILQTENLCKSFKGQKIVENLSLTIPRNSVYGLLGPNGAEINDVKNDFRHAASKFRDNTI